MSPEERQLSLVAYLIHYRYGRTLEEICEDLPSYGHGAAARKKLQRDRKLLEKSGLWIRVVAQEGESVDGNLRYLYQLERQKVFARSLRLNHEERDALGKLCDTLAREPDFRFRDLASAVRRKLLQDLGPESDSGERLTSAQDSRPAGWRDENQEPWLPELLDAMNRGRCLSILYQGVGDDVAEQRIIHPLRLTLSGGTWLLVAWCENRKAQRHFRPFRIKELEQLDQKIDASRKEQARLAGRDMDLAGRAWSMGLCHNPNGKCEHPVRVEFDPAVARMARVQLEGLATLETRKDESLLANCRVTDSVQFWRWLLGWGRRARLLGPGQEQERLTAWLNDLVDAHRGGTGS